MILRFFLGYDAVWRGYWIPLFRSSLKASAGRGIGVVDTRPSVVTTVGNCPINGYDSRLLAVCLLNNDDRSR
jgi:hypothetical protein